MQLTPRIFHQIWLGGKPLPLGLKGYTNTWVNQHSEWMFKLWNDEKSEALIKDKYPNLLDQYNKAPFLTQRVDIIKYLLLHEFGGVYIDLDCECLKPIDSLLTNMVSIGLEPRDEILHREFPIFLGSAFMSAVPKSAFFRTTIEQCEKQLNLLSPNHERLGKYNYVMETTGPTLINRIYQDFDKKEEITLHPPEIIGPFRSREATLYRENKHAGYGADKLKNAYAIHHFVGSWL